jgi:hypothetical protein
MRCFQQSRRRLGGFDVQLLTMNASILSHNLVNRCLFRSLDLIHETGLSVVRLEGRASARSEMLVRGGRDIGLAYITNERTAPASNFVAAIAFDDADAALWTSAK